MFSWSNNNISSNMNNGYNNYQFNNGNCNNMCMRNNAINYQNNNYNGNYYNNNPYSNNQQNNYSNGYYNNQNNYNQQNSYDNNYNKSNNIQQNNNVNYDNGYNQNNYNQQNNNNTNYNNISNQNNPNNYNQQYGNANYNNNQYQNNNNYNGQNNFNINSNGNNIQQLKNNNYFYNDNNSNNNNMNYNLFNQQSKNRNNQFQNKAGNQGNNNFNNKRIPYNNINFNYPKDNVGLNQNVGYGQNQNNIFNEVYNNKGVNINNNNQNNNFGNMQINQNNNDNNNQIYNDIYLSNNQNLKGQNNANNNNPNTDQNNFQAIKMQNLAPKTNIIKQPKDKIPLDFLTRATGLDNVGATCYMNATLQCFYHVKALSENIINDDKIKDNLKLTYCYKNLIIELAGCKEKKKYLLRRQYYVDDEKIKDSIKPKKFKELISEMNPIFKGVQANDSKDLILFLLETMDKELTLRNNKNQEMQRFYGNSEDEMAPENFKKCHNSIFADIFYGFQKSVIKCESCGHESPNYSVMNFLIFHLEKTYNELNPQKNNTNINMNNMNNINNMNMYNMNNMNNMNNMHNMNNNMNRFSNNYNNFRINMGNQNLNPQTFQPMKRSRNNMNMNNMNNVKKEKKKLTLAECFKHSRNAENLTGQNMIYCNACNRNSNAVMFDEIHQAPNVLIIILNRGKGNIFECDLDFPKQLNLSDYISNPSSPKFYELIGVISHFGESSMGGHFIAYCKHFDGCWYIFNDSTVRQINEDDDFKGIPYILFYKNAQWED